MIIPCTCTGCQIGRACRQRDHDHKPATGLEHALKEAADAIAAVEAATKRLHEAMANLVAAQVIESAKGPEQC